MFIQLRYTIWYSNEFGNKLIGEECANLEIAKQKTDSQNQVFNGLSLSELFYDSYTDELSEHVEVWHSISNSEKKMIY